MNATDNKTLGVAPGARGASMAGRGASTTGKGVARSYSQRMQSIPESNGAQNEKAAGSRDVSPGRTEQV